MLASREQCENVRCLRCHFVQLPRLHSPTQPLHRSRSSFKPYGTNSLLHHVYVLLGLTHNLQIFVLKRLLSTRAAHPLVHEHPISPTSVTVPITPQLFSCCSCKSCSTIMQQLWKVKLVTHNYAVMQVCEISNHSIDVE